MRVSLQTKVCCGTVLLLISASVSRVPSLDGAGVASGVICQPLSMLIYVDACRVKVVISVLR